MDETLTGPDPLADVRDRAPSLSSSGVDYGVLPQLTGFSLKMAWILGNGLLARELGELGVTPHRFSMLEVIGRNPGLQPMQLAAALALTRPATTLALDFWEDRQCIERRKVAGDRRSFGVYATDTGMEEIERLRAIFRRSDDVLTSKLTHAEELEFRRLLKKIHL